MTREVSYTEDPARKVIIKRKQKWASSYMNNLKSLFLMLAIPEIVNQTHKHI